MLAAGGKLLTRDLARLGLVEEVVAEQHAAVLHRGHGAGDVLAVHVGQDAQPEALGFEGRPLAAFTWRDELGLDNGTPWDFACQVRMVSGS